ncbi:MAG: hypothetical protein ACJ8FY_27130 [Gemmataceae bacterium]
MSSKTPDSLAPPSAVAPTPSVSKGARPGKPPATALGLILRSLLTFLVVGLCFVTFDGKTLFGTLSGLVPGFPAGLLALVATSLVALALVVIWRGVITIDSRFQAPLLITYIIAVGHATYGILENHYSPLLDELTRGWVTTYSPTFVAIATAIIMELVLARILTGKWPHLASAYISGISVGILIKSPELWPYIFCSVITIASKYAIRVKGRHIWNPSNFGVTLMLVLAADSVASLSVQSGNEIWPVIVIFMLGSLIIYRLGRLHIPLAYVAAFIPLAYLRSLATGNTFAAEVGPMTSPMFQLFIFFMITDPKTTTHRRWSQIAVAVLVAVADHILRLYFRDQHSFYHSLFIVGPITNLVEIWWTSERGQKIGARNRAF